jgi:hypothetical protein
VEAGFTASLASAVTEDFVAADEQDVGDKLLIAFVVLGVAAVEVKQVRRGGENGKIFPGVQAQALKNAQFFKEFPFKTKHSFFGWHRENLDLKFGNVKWNATAANAARAITTSKSPEAFRSFGRGLLSAL